jgi:hypothetical protein
LESTGRRIDNKEFGQTSLMAAIRRRQTTSSGKMTMAALDREMLAKEGITGQLELAANGTFGTNTGILGAYTVNYSNEVRQQQGGQGNGEFVLTLTSQVVEPLPNGGGGGTSVPDAGSTMALMGMALCTLGGFARRFKA